MEYIESIRAVLNRATDTDWSEGLDWYRTAQETATRLASTYGTDTDTVARIIAVLSPRQRWSSNVAAAEYIIRAWSEGSGYPSVAGVFGANVRKAWNIINGDPDALKGPKVTRFYWNIMGDDSHVTLDVWAMRAAGSDDIAPRNPAQYAEIADAYVTVAHENNVPASALQAVAWTVIRGKAA